MSLRRALGLRHGFEVELHKGIALGSGMGGSAASCVAALVAANALLERPLSREALYGFALDGEQVASGSRNALRLRVYGTRASLSFDQEHPEELWWSPQGEPARCLRRGGSPMSHGVSACSRLPAGHPEGYLEAFAQLYRDFARTWRGEPVDTLPGLDDGLAGMRFIEAVLRSHQEGMRWVPL